MSMGISETLKLRVSTRRSHCRDAWKQFQEVEGQASSQALLNCVAMEVLCIHTCQVQFEHAVQRRRQNSDGISIVYQLIREGLKLDSK